MSAKVRYYLEQTVPELEDLQKKDFEHRLASRGSKTRDYLKYVDYETNLERLRKKRYSRLSSVGLINTKPSISDWASERRILFIYDRAVQKFPNDLQILGGILKLKKQKLFKKIYKIYTQLLQLHPTSIASWISAANFEYEYVGSAKNARTLFQRALRFNKDSKKLWISYTLFELSYITKLLSRRKILGLITEKQQRDHEASEQSNVEQHEEDDGMIQLPTVTHEELKGALNTLPDADMNMLGNPETNPALKGDVALTVAEIAIDTLFALKTNTTISEFEFKYQLCLEFITLFTKFEELNRLYLGQHMVDYLMRQFDHEPKAIVLDITLPLRYVSVNDVNEIDILQSCTNKYLAYKSKAQNVNDKADLKSLLSTFLTTKFLEDDSINDKTKQILHSIVKKL
ncbi:U3 small nucleolar RNA-associated protein 6 [Cyberlindnera fabianii]|uniref:U3 small nucleolar RNA-associated protein 6 n=1 Tax=Cyberlindnera fabianii TaxID=36022 RepID=A0A1V2KYZ8_CYBFA|nr:U3 small nucleolar RNA-associated protein 6 [Cyberlindnera fabianii]